MRTVHVRGLSVAILIVASTVIPAFAHPGSGIVVDRRGYVYFADTGSGVWMIDPGGRLRRHDGPQYHWMAIDEGKRPFGARLPSVPSGAICAVGVNPTLLLSSDVPLTVGSDGALYYPESGPDKRLRIVRFTRSGMRSVRATLPSNAEGGAVRWVNGIAAGPDGAVYYTEDNAVRRVNRRGLVSTVAGNVALPNCARIPGTEGVEPYFRGLAVTRDGTVFVAASGCGAVLKITARGKITTVLQSSSPWSPTAVAVSPTGLYVLEYTHTVEENRQAWLPRVRRVRPNGGVATLATVER